MGRKWKYQEKFDELKDNNGKLEYLCCIDFKGRSTGQLPKMYYRHLNRAINKGLKIERVQFSVFKCSLNGSKFLKILADEYGASIHRFKVAPAPF